MLYMLYVSKSITVLLVCNCMHISVRAYMFAVQVAKVKVMHFFSATLQLCVSFAYFYAWKNTFAVSKKKELWTIIIWRIYILSTLNAKCARRNPLLNALQYIYDQIKMQFVACTCVCACMREKRSFYSNNWLTRNRLCKRKTRKTKARHVFKCRLNFCYLGWSDVCTSTQACLHIV